MLSTGIDKPPNGRTNDILLLEEIQIEGWLFADRSSADERAATNLRLGYGIAGRIEFAIPHL